MWLFFNYPGSLKHPEDHFSLIRSNICHLLGQEAFFVGSLTLDLSLTWNTDHFYSNMVTKSKLYYMYHLHKDVISVKNLSQ